LRILRVEKEIIYNFPARALALADATDETASSREKYVSAKRAVAFLEVSFCAFLRCLLLLLLLFLFLRHFKARQSSFSRRFVVVVLFWEKMTIESGTILLFCRFLGFFFRIAQEANEKKNFARKKERKKDTNQKPPT
tara:strand:- start:47 stop:457 length:411 start_codon:yes stop_codon:yes gene_type:complete